MAKPTTTTAAKPTWSPSAWTPIRCKVWNLLDGEAQAGFTAWIADEAKANDGGCYSNQIRPQDQALLDAHATAQAA